MGGIAAGPGPVPSRGVWCPEPGWLAGSCAVALDQTRADRSTPRSTAQGAVSPHPGGFENLINVYATRNLRCMSRMIISRIGFSLVAIDILAITGKLIGVRSLQSMIYMVNEDVHTIDIHHIVHSG